MDQNIKEYRKQYYKKNREKIQKQQVEYRKKYKAKQLKQMEVLATAIIEIFKDREKENK